MPQLIWTPDALRAIQRCYRFLVPKNPDAASRAVKAIREHMLVLESHPAIGRPADKMSAEFREILIPFGESGYVALYRMDGDRVVVLTVRHQSEAGYS